MEYELSFYLNFSPKCCWREWNVNNNNNIIVFMFWKLATLASTLNMRITVIINYSEVLTIPEQ